MTDVSISQRAQQENGGAEIPPPSSGGKKKKENIEAVVLICGDREGLVRCSYMVVVRPRCVITLFLWYIYKVFMMRRVFDGRWKNGANRFFALTSEGFQ